MCFEGRVEHYRIIYQDDQITIDEEEYFPNLSKLVEVILSVKLSELLSKSTRLFSITLRTQTGSALLWERRSQGKEGLLIVWTRQPSSRQAGQ